MDRAMAARQDEGYGRYSMKAMIPLHHGFVVASLALTIACSTESEPAPGDPGSGGAGGETATGGASSATGGSDPACGGEGQAGAAGSSGVPQQEDTGVCFSWVGRECAEEADGPLQVRVEVDGVLDAVLDAPVEDECSPDVFFFWNTCIGLRPSLWAKSSAEDAVLDLQLRHRHTCVETPRLELAFGEYRDSSGVTWSLEELADEPYTVPVLKGKPSAGVLDTTHGYRGRDADGNEVELRIHAVACAAYYPCLF